MRKTINPYWKARLFWIFLLLAAIIAWAASGCNPAKISARKDERALGRVFTSPSLLRSAYARGAELWPCANDTQFILKPGRIDSIPYPVLFDTTDRGALRDSVLAAELPGYEKKCNDAIKKAYDMGIQFAAQQFSKLRIPRHAPDTLGGFIVDRRLVKSLADTIVAKEKAIEFYRGSAAQWKKTSEDYLADKRKILLFGGLAVTLLAVALGLAIAFIFKSKTLRT